MAAIETRISALRLDFQPLAQAWQEMVQGYVLPARFPGFKMRITETKRDAARQAEVLANGKSNLKLGLHNVGRALDFMIADAMGVYISDGLHPAYEACGLVAEALGCKWGGHMDMDAAKPGVQGDYDHIQYLGNLSNVHAALVEAGLST